MGPRMSPLKFSSVIFVITFCVSRSEAKAIDNIADMTNDDIFIEKYADENVEYEDEVVTGRESSEELSVTEANIESRFNGGERIYPELGDDFEGDIALTEEQKQRMSLNEPQSKTKTISTRKHWPTNAKGQAIVPYVIAAEYCESKSFYSYQSDAESFFNSSTRERNHQKRDELYSSRFLCSFCAKK